MLMVVQKGREREVIAIFEKWDLPAASIGEVTDDGLLKFYMDGEMVAEIPAYELVLGGGAPQYERPYSEPEYLKKINAFDPETVDVPDDLRGVAEQVIALPNIASKKWVAVQYDSTVGAANSSTNQPSDAAVVLAKGTGKALAMTTDCNSRYVYADPYKGAMIAVAEAARNIVCSGGQPLGVTNCLNFGNPYNPEVYYQFVQLRGGMSVFIIRILTARYIRRRRSGWSGC
jgi:phosphoribosylformylglycinamidine (FGAM) synthase-like enzyme